ncbi:MAG: DUF1674 domain-containing protein [Alphaproteobacteria bacterium]|nr:MAG: DUF1674 domain-containing protein [Alphaproteobacteria bacterium]
MTDETVRPGEENAQKAASGDDRSRPRQPQPRRPREIGGPSGPEPTRYGDWERKGICVDF